jgi:hypothetical protein
MGSCIQVEIAICSNGAGRSNDAVPNCIAIGSRIPLRAGRTLRTLHALRAGGPLRAGRSLRTLRTRGALGADH